MKNKDDFMNGIEYKFECKLIEDFFKDEYLKLDELLDNRALTYWSDIHHKSNSLTLDDIRIICGYLRFEKEERDLYFEDLVNAFNRLYIFDLSSPEIEGLSSKSIANLTEYNSIIVSFIDEFNEIKDELAIEIGITKNS